MTAVSALILVSCSKWEKNIQPENTNPGNFTYTASTEDIVNPERGFYRQVEIFSSNYIPLDKSVLAGYRTPNNITGATYTAASSLVFAEYVLDSFTNSPISADFLAKFDQDCAAARAAGVKLILRFVYTSATHSGGCPTQSICPPYGDAPKAIVLGHISQLAPVWQKNEDIIACMQLGFIGIWGENYYTDYFGDASSNGQNKLLDQNWADRIEVLKAMLAAVPADRMVQVRTPQFKERYVYGVNAKVLSPALTDAEAFNGSDKARIGFHNDCFLSSADDYGTYVDFGNSSTPAGDATTALRNFEIADTKYTVVGGETCDNAYSPQNDCEPAGKAQSEFEAFHYSFLNAGYNVAVNNDWVTGGCISNIKQKLGYRFVLRTAVIPATARVGATINVSLNIDNVGYASPFNPRPVQLLLRNKASGKVTAINFDTDIRKWYTGTIDLKQNLVLPPEVVPGTYDVLLNMPDKYASIASRPEYSIQLANQDTWEAATGYNKLNATIQVN